MSKAVKAAGLGLVIFVTVWVVTLWQWYRSQQPVSSEEVATQLILLPAGLTVVALLAWWGAARLRRWLAKPVEVAPAQVSASASGASAAATAQPVAAVPLGLVSILAEALALPNGDDPELAWSALRSGQVRPGLDPHLQDADGMPVFSSRMPELSTQDWLDAHAEVTDRTLPESLLRAMALVEAPLHRLLSALPVGLGDGSHAMHGLAGGAASVEAGVASGPAFLSGVGQPGAREQASRRRDTAPALDIQVWVPADWPEAHRTLFIGWLRQQAGMALDWARASGSGEPRWSLEPLDAPEAGWDRLLPPLNELHADPRPRLLLVLAAHSLVDEASVTGLQARGELFTTQHQGGRVPGEGAAGLLLANAAMAARCADEGQHPWLGVPGSTRRQRSAERAGRPGADEITTAMQQVLAPWAQWPASQAAPGGWWCVSDADHRPSRASELFEAYQALQPDGDAMQAVQRLGDAWGDLGIARALVPVAMAASVVRQRLTPEDVAATAAVPALVGLLQGSHRRWAIPVWPASVGLEALARLSSSGACALPASSFNAAAPVAEPLAA